MLELLLYMAAMWGEDLPVNTRREPVSGRPPQVRVFCPHIDALGNEMINSVTAVSLPCVSCSQLPLCGGEVPR